MLPFGGAYEGIDEGQRKLNQRCIAITLLAIALLAVNGLTYTAPQNPLCNLFSYISVVFFEIFPRENL